jgi:DnaJ-class molecular chaperone
MSNKLDGVLRCIALFVVAWLFSFAITSTGQRKQQTKAVECWFCDGFGVREHYMTGAYRQCGMCSGDGWILENVTIREE